MDEIFKVIPNTDGNYVVYRDGSIKSLRTGKFLVGDHNNCGYARVMVSVGDKQHHLFRHRLVAQAFIPNPDPDKLRAVDHIDGNKDHNSVDNLRWVDDFENMRAAYRTRHKENYKPFEVTFADGTVKAYETKTQLADELGITPAAVKAWIHKAPSMRPNKGYLKRGIVKIVRSCQLF